MMIRGVIRHIAVVPITTKRGTTTMTSLRVSDAHDHAQHGGASREDDATWWEAQWVDSKLFCWSEAITDAFQVGDYVLVHAEDDVRTRIDTERSRATLVARGIDLGLATLPDARRD